MTDALLACALSAVVLVYAYFFIVLPQNWTLRDDYAFALNWGRPGADVWHEGLVYLRTLLSTGRFQPVDVLSRILHYGYLPVTPRAFRVGQFMLGAVGVAAFVSFLEALAVSRTRILLATLLVISNLAFKEWLTTLTVSEAWATTFLLAALVAYVRGRRWAATPLLILAFFSKESFVVFCGLFPLLEYLRPHDSRKLARRIQPALAPVAASAVFAVFIQLLPHIYTAGLSVSRLAFEPILTSLVLPPLKSLGPAFLLLAAGWPDRLSRLSRTDRTLAILGVYIVVVYTVFLNAWGPFDSWFYLHTPIPFGWALLFAAIWQPRGGALQGAATVLTAGYCVFITANGARHYVDYFASAREVAQLACRDAERTPKLKLYCNCNEGSAQLVNAMKLGNACANPPNIVYLAGALQAPIDEAGSPYELLLSSKCDPFDFGTVPASATRDSIDVWTIVRAR